MISPTTAPQYYGGNSAATTATGGKKTLDKDAFLQLFVTQLKHQDPMSPLQPDQLAAQLAQFTSVEQLTQLNDAMTGQTAAVNMQALVGQTSLSASLIGRQVVASGDQVLIPQSGNASVHVDIGGTGGEATLSLKDASGNVVATRSLGPVAPGSQDLALPKDLPPGEWHYAIDVKDAKGTTTAATTYTTGVVSGVEFKNNKISLFLGGIELSLDNLVRIEPAPTGSGGSGGSGSPTPSTYAPRPSNRGPLGGPTSPTDDTDPTTPRPGAADPLGGPRGPEGLLNRIAGSLR